MSGRHMRIVPSDVESHTDPHIDAEGHCACSCSRCFREPPGKWYDVCACPACNCGELARRWGGRP